MMTAKKDTYDAMKWCNYIVRALCIGLMIGLPSLVFAQSATSQAESTSFVYTSVLDDPEIQRLGDQGLQYLYNMKMDEANAIFDEIESRYPDHPIGPFLKALITWWQILPDLAVEDYDEEFERQMQEVIDRCERLIDEERYEFDAIFFKGAALGYRGRLLSNRGSWFRAARDGRGAMKYIFRIADRDASNADYIFGLGVYHYFAYMVPKKYPVVRPFMTFFPDGDRDRGLAELERVAEEGRFIRAEATYFLLQIYMVYEPDYRKAVEYIQRLRTQYPDNPFFHILEGIVHGQWGRWRTAQPIFEEVVERYLEGWPGYTDGMGEKALYYRARALMVRGEFSEALNVLLQVEALSSRRTFDNYYRVLGRLRQGMCYDALGQRAIAEVRYREVLEMEDQGGAHDRAKRYLKTPYR